jgi:outer membrane protein OmpA-like peptidoglycan-associated protein
MNKRVVGVFLLLLIGGLLLVGGKYLRDYLYEKNQRTTSDAVHTKGRIRIAMDSWIGYFPLCSNDMKSEMHRAGWLLECADDKANYQQRMTALSKGEYDLVVATVDSYLLNGKTYDFPGAIIAVLDESKGGDAIVARKERFANLDAVRKGGDIKVAFTPGSPSHYLLKAAADHFDLPVLLPVRSDLRIETEGSEKALAKLLAGTTDIAVLWEPDVSRALAKPEIVKLLGTEETERLIVDILISNRKFMQRQPEAVSLLLATYFKVLKKFRDDPEKLLREVMSETGLDKQTVEAMLKGIVWLGLNENCEKWFGIAGPGGKAEERIAATIDSTANILVHSGDFSQSPVPGNDSYRLVKRSFLEELYAQGISGFTKPRAEFDSSGQARNVKGLSALDEQGWEALSEVGTLKLKPIVFRDGSSELDMLAGVELDDAAEKLSHYPSFRIVVKGHTGTRGDAPQNIALSRQRAESVAEYLKGRHGIDPNRLHPVGLGGTKPLPQKENESLRAYEHRLPRVELVLVREEL